MMKIFQIKYVPFIIAAVCIDGLQALLAFGLTGIGSVIPIAGNAFGMVLGFVADICITVTFGPLLIMSLGYFDMYNPLRIGTGAIFEMLPGLDALPGWTVMTITCILKKTQEDGELTGSAAVALGGALLPGSMVGKAVRVAKTMQQKTSAASVGSGLVNNKRLSPQRIRNQQTVRQDLKSIDGISPKSSKKFSEQSPEKVYA